VLFRPLPFREPSQLAQLWETTPALPQLQATVPDYQDWRKQTRRFEQISAYTFQAMNKITLIGPGEPEVVQATMATHDLFSTLGVRPLLGRDFTTEDEQRKEHVALISENLWRKKFAGDPAIIGKQLRLETLTFTVIGVISTEQAFPTWADVWLPFSLIESELQSRRKYHPIEVIARLKTDATESEAQTEIQTIAKQLSKEYPETNENVGAYLIPLSRQLTGEVRPTLLLVWAAVGLVLLIVCANVAHLMMGRMLDHRHEMAVRLALGASRLHLVQQIVTESLLLGIAGGTLGSIIARWLTEILHRMAANQIPRMEWAGVPGPVWVFTAGASILCSLLFAMPSCWQALTFQAPLASGTRDGGRAVTRQRSRLSSTLVVAEFALAFVVLAGAVLLVRSFIALLDEEPGFTSKGIVAVEVPSTRYDPTRAHEFFDSQLIPALAALPGVAGVAAANSAPMTLGTSEHSRFATRFGVEGVTYPQGQYPVTQIRWVTPDYFRVLEIPLQRGRWLTEDDRGKPRILINETLARQFYPNDDPTTKRLVTGVLDPQKTLSEIVGIVGDVHEMGLDVDVAPTFYFISSGPVMTLLMRTSAEPEQLLASVQQTIHRVDPQIAVTRAKTLDEYLRESLARRRLALTILGLFGGLGAFLTAAGIYGALACSVHARRREFGVRMAVGATTTRITTMILGETAIIAIPGIGLGAMLYLLFARFMKSFVYKLSPSDPASILTVAALLSLVALLSAWVPARRASAVDPGESLRAE